MNKFYLIIIVGLVAIIGYFDFTVKNKEKEIQKLTVENFTLNDKLKSQISVSNGKYKIVYKEGKPGKNTETVKYINTYVPPENTHTIITTGEDDKIEIIYNKYGITFTPFLGFSFGNKLSPEIGARLFYWGRWGTGLSTSFENLKVFVDYRIDWDYAKNTSVGLFMANDKEYGVVVHTFF